MLTHSIRFVSMRLEILDGKSCVLKDRRLRRARSEARPQRCFAIMTAWLVVVSFATKEVVAMDGELTADELSQEDPSSDSLDALKSRKSIPKKKATLLRLSIYASEEYVSHVL
jgi:hypothetical protein